MDIRTAIAASLLVICTSPACAQDATTLPPVEVGPLFVADCVHPVLPSQRQVGEWTGLHNFGQAYAARGQLMADIAQVCQRPGTDRVQIVFGDGRRQDAGRRVAVTSDAR